MVRNGDTDHDNLLKNMQPVLEGEELVFCTLSPEQAEKYIPEDPILRELWPEISRPYIVRTDPEGVDGPTWCGRLDCRAAVASGVSVPARPRD